MIANLFKLILPSKIVIGRGNPDYKPVEIRTSVPVKEKNLTDQVLIDESGTFQWLPAKRSLKQRQCRSIMKKELEAHDFSRGRMSQKIYPSFKRVLG